jgi:transposase
VGIPLKKDTYPEKQDCEEVQKERKEFLEKIEKIDVSKIVALDESSVNLAFTRLYGRAPIGERIHEGIKDVRFERQSVLSTLRTNGDMKPIVFSGTLNKELFAEYIKTQLAPNWKPGDFLLMDNSSVHKSKIVLETLDKCGIDVLWLPRYSPDFNPIELFWTFMKSILRKFKARSHEKLNSAIAFAFNSLSPGFVKNWFKHCNFII